MKTGNDRKKDRPDYRDALEFIGETRAGISRERFFLKVVANFDAFIDFLSDGQEARQFLAQRGIARSYVVKNLENILEKTYFNAENDHYLALGLPHNASDDQIHDRWKRLMFLYHPDRNRGSNGNVLAYAARINEVYSVLKDAARRKEYDRAFNRRRPASPEPSEEARLSAVLRKNIRREYQFRVPIVRRTVLSRIVLPLWLAICLFLLLLILLENNYLAF